MRHLNKSGNSGAMIGISEDGRTVYKYSNEPATSRKIKNQSERLRALSGFGILVPGSIADLENGYSMDFISGDGADSILCSGTADQKNSVVEVVVLATSKMEARSKLVPYPLAWLSSKIAEVEQKVGSSTITKLAGDFILSDTRPILSGESHGDLTLGNLILSTDGRLFFIDPILDELNSVDYDIAKLTMDLRYGWSHFISGGSGWADQSIIFPKSNSARPGLIVLSLLRILPYARSQAVTEWLTQAIKSEVLK